jgi:carboxylesterase type B
MHSNGPGARPRTLAEVVPQFEELRKALGVAACTSQEALERMRAMPVEKLLGAASKMRLHQFRVVADGEFVRESLFDEIEDGRFAKMLKDAGVRLVIGECADEHFMYARYRPPLEPSFKSMFSRLRADYPDEAVAALARHYAPKGLLPSRWKSWNEGFGKLYADIQIHATQRGLVDALARHGAGDLVKRYRIEWRAKCADRVFPPEFGATHGADTFLWWFGDTMELQSEEKKMVQRAFLEELGKFLRGEAMSWGTRGPKDVRRLQANGQVDIWTDELWDDGLAVWDTLRHARKGDGFRERYRL